jgi:hypothetical protein
MLEIAGGIALGIIGGVLGLLLVIGLIAKMLDN